MKRLYLVTALVSANIPEGYDPESVGAENVVEMAVLDAVRDSERLSAEVRYVLAKAMPPGYELIVEEETEELA